MSDKVSAAHSVAEAHARLQARGDIQFDMPMPTPTPKPDVPSFRFPTFDFGSFGNVIFWGVIIAVAALLVWLVVRHFWTGRASADATADPEREVAQWRPEERQARELLAEADAMAAAGKYAEAAHLLLHRSLQDIQQRRPKALRPALTSREIAVADLLPGVVRSAFAAMAAPVGRSLFGGRALNRQDWEEARTAYGEFALPGAWK